MDFAKAKQVGLEGIRSLRVAVGELSTALEEIEAAVEGENMLQVVLAATKIPHAWIKVDDLYSYLKDSYADLIKARAEEALNEVEKESRSNGGNKAV